MVKVLSPAPAGRTKNPPQDACSGWERLSTGTTDQVASTLTLPPLRGDHRHHRLLEKRSIGPPLSRSREPDGPVPPDLAP